MSAKIPRREFLKSIDIATGAVALGARSAESAEMSTASRAMTAQAASSRPVTLTYVNYSIGVDKPMWDSLIAEFNKIHPKITVKCVPTPGDSWGDYFDKLATMIAGGNSPDVSRVTIEGTRLMVSRGLAIPLDDYMKGDPQVDNYHV